MKTTALLLLLFTGAVSCGLADSPDHFQGSPVVWRQLRGVDGPAVRAACAALGGRLYLLGGGRRGVRGDLVPSNELQELDVAAGRWETLGSCPVSVWGGAMLADSGGNRLVVLGGQDKAGVPIAKNTLKVAIYGIDDATWEAFEINHDGIGQPTRAFMHNNMVAMLTENPAAVVLVDLEKRWVVTTTPCPDGLVPRDGVIVGDTVFICEARDMSSARPTGKRSGGSLHHDQSTEVHCSRTDITYCPGHLGRLAHAPTPRSGKSMKTLASRP
jgi:hypothetical protein